MGSDDIVAKMTAVIAAGQNVSIHYRLTLDDGAIVEDLFNGDPMVYEHGSGRIVPGLERQLAGKSAGDECTLHVEAAEAYGDYDPGAEQVVSRTQFPAEADIEPGISFQATGPQGPVSVWVTNVEGDNVTISTNHPLAGQRLTFQVRIVDVRKASAKQAAPADSG